ncbi:MAG: hypothetical protein AAGD14_05305 [Planctomycetota bacterium]
MASTDSARRFYLRLMLSTSIPFGLSTAVVYFITMPVGAAAVASVLSGLLCGAGMAWLMGTIHLRQARAAGSPDPTAVDQHVVVQLATDPAAAVERAVEAIRALPRFQRFRDEDEPLRRVAETGATWRSFGEVIEIVAKPPQAGVTVLGIASRARKSGTLADYGQNWKNVQAIRDAVIA